ncbi:unnamed protein product [Hymenolepis diminuta]|uniref:Uncharacterized protein n=1 Tax=Hymenolepis diminuta TaxID=6216 RepID=A0A564Z6C8_HYMDI|nr:unnamed protein product [Hymenolepis diminuta]
MSYFQRTRHSLVHLHAPRRRLQPAQQFTWVTIDRMAHRQKVLLELGEVACYIKRMSMIKLGWSSKPYPLPVLTEIIEIGNGYSGYHLGSFWALTTCK